MVERKAYHQLDPIKLKKAEFDRLPLRQEVKGEAYKAGALYRDAAYPGEVFQWKDYETPVKGEWTRPDAQAAKKFGDVSKLPERQAGQSYKNGDAVQVRAPGREPELRVWRDYPKGSEIKGEWLMAAADLG